MGNKQHAKREFDWRTYSKPARELSPAQESAFQGGILRGVLEWALATPGARFEIRARQAAVYSRGTQLLRVRGAEQPFRAEIDANVRLPRDQRSGAEQLEMWPLDSPEEVAACVAELESLRRLAETFCDASALSERESLHSFATVNASEDGPMVVVDTEYQYGKRRFDFVGMKRAEGVAGAGGFTTPRLIVGQFKTAGRPLSGATGLAPTASDFAEFATALGGEHLRRAKAELGDLVAQKQRLGLLPGSIPFRHFTADAPEYLVVLSGFDPADPGLDEPVASVHERLVARHFSPDLLRFSAVGGSENPESLRLGENDELSYREFKGMRRRLRG